MYVYIIAVIYVYTLAAVYVYSIEGAEDEDDFHGERTEDQMKMDAERKFIEEVSYWVK